MRFAAILNKFAVDVRGASAEEGWRGMEEQNLEGKGHEHRDVTRMLDMYDLHDFC